MKKFFVILLIVLLSACSSTTPSEETKHEEKEYLVPANDVEVFDYLNSDTQKLLLTANNNETMKSDVLVCLGKELVDYEFVDYYGNVSKLSDYKTGKLIIEISAYWCTHCMKQCSQYNDELLKAYPDVTIIQYFNEGGKEEIDGFYKEINKPIPNDVIVVPNDKKLSSLLMGTYNLKYYPEFLIFNDGILNFVRISELTKEEMDLAKNVAFDKAVDFNRDLVDENGTSIFTYCRTSADVKNDLSKENYQRLADLDNDTFTINETLKYLGKDFDISEQLGNDSEFISEVDFASLDKKDIVIIYLYEDDDDKIQLINDYQDLHPNINVIILNTSDNKCKEMAMKAKVPVVSIMNQIPKILNNITFNSYPSCIFVENGIITGIYSNILNIECLNKATDIFMGENSIALKKNN